MASLLMAACPSPKISLSYLSGGCGRGGGGRGSQILRQAKKSSSLLFLFMFPPSSPSFRSLRCFPHQILLSHLLSVSHSYPLLYFRHGGMILLFLFILIFYSTWHIHSITFTQNFHSLPFAEVPLYLLIAGSGQLSGKNLGGVPSRELNSSLWKPTHYQPTPLPHHYWYFTSFPFLSCCFLSSPVLPWLFLNFPALSCPPPLSVLFLFSYYFLYFPGLSCTLLFCAFLFCLFLFYPLLSSSFLCFPTLFFSFPVLSTLSGHYLVNFSLTLPYTSSFIFYALSLNNNIHFIICIMFFQDFLLTLPAPGPPAPGCRSCGVSAGARGDAG